MHIILNVTIFFLTKRVGDNVFDGTGEKKNIAINKNYWQLIQKKIMFAILQMEYVITLYAVTTV